MNYKLSNQAIGAVMMALQKSLMEQTDIVPVLQGFQLCKLTMHGQLVVTNPPVGKIRRITSNQNNGNKSSGYKLMPRYVYSCKSVAVTFKFGME
jgi:hypothetical protein